MPSIRACASSGSPPRNDFMTDSTSPVETLRADHAELTALRRDLHAHPELGFEEHRTAEIVVRELTALGIEHHSGIGKTGIVGVIRGERQESGRAVGLRADMTPSPAGQGLFNLGTYSNKRVDELSAQIASELDQTKRNAMIAEAFKIHSDDIGHIPLHQQALAWAMKKNVELVQLADNFNLLKWVVIK